MNSKKTIIKIGTTLLSCAFFCLLSTSLLTGCIDYDDISHHVNGKVQIQLPNEINNAEQLQGHTVTITLGAQKFSAVTDADGIATFNDIQPDIYDISTAWELTGDEYSQLTGEASKVSGAIVSGGLSSQPFTEEQESEPILLPTSMQVKRDIVISKIASAGSKDANNKVYPYGKYLELYNQSDDSIDVSGLYIGLTESSNPQPYTLDNLHEDYADSVVIVKQVFQIPADKPYLIGPGGTLLLTNSATDHSDVNELEHDLTGADFESKGANNHVNNPDVPALLTTFTIFVKNSSMNLMQGGPCGVIIFRTTEDIDQWQHTYGYGKTTGSLFYLCVPTRVIIDGVDYLKNKATGVDITSKRLYTTIDAGYTHIESVSGYTGEVVYRRTEKTAADGHKILMDTNNSSNDFKVSTTIKPREYDEAE